MTGRERVKRAIEFRDPDHGPLWLFNKDTEQGDVAWFDFRIQEGAKREGYHGSHLSEWGYTWRTLNDGTMGQPTEAVIKTWDNLRDYKFPKVDRERRLAGLEGFKKKTEGLYRIPLLIITGFNTYTFMRGFEQAMVDLAEDSAECHELLDGIFGFEKELITLAAESGFDGFHFGDDWGTQETTILSPEMWKRTFKRRYKEQFDYAHSLGLHVWFHSCGNIGSLIGELHDLKVDVINVAQPNVVDIEGTCGPLKGKQCFLLPVSYQTISISGSSADIAEETKRLHRAVGSDRGGFIGYVEEYGCMGMSEENYRACVDSFRALG